MAVIARLAIFALATIWGATGISAQASLAHRATPPLRFEISDSITVPRLSPAPIPQSATASKRLGEIGLLIGVLGVALGSSAIEEPQALDCGPCDRADVPFFDRWAITKVREEWDVLSTATLLTTAGIAWVDVFKRSEGSGFAHLGASLESVALTLAATDLLKRAAERRRPFTYQENLADIDMLSLNDAKTSWPSGHTSVAFSLGTSYWLSRGHEASPTLKKVVFGATVLSGLLRIPAGRHFPSDVISGAALGMGSALLVHTIRF